jgi:hypothetical protein
LIYKHARAYRNFIQSPPTHSTGGILAVLFGIEKKSISQAEALYDSLVSKIFASSPLIQTTKLLLRQSYYDEVVWEQVLQEMLGALPLLCVTCSMSPPAVPLTQHLHIQKHNTQATTS